MRHRLAEAGLEISAGKMSARWTTTPTSIRLEDLDVICAVLDCTPRGPDDLRARKVAARKPKARAAQTTSSGRQGSRRGWDCNRSLPPA